MPKLDFDYDKIKTLILPVFENTQIKLDSSYNNSFFDAGEYSGRIASIREQIVQAKSSVVSLNNWLENSMNSIKTVSESLESDASSLPVCDIVLRESPINFE